MARRYVRWKGETVKGFSDALSYAGEHLSGWARGWMHEAVKKSLSQIDSEWPHSSFKSKGTIVTNLFGGDKFHPWYSGHLHDSVVAIVSDKHRTVAIEYMPPSAETATQTYNGQTVVGRDAGEIAAMSAQRVLHFLPGTVASIFVGVPYADKVDDMPRHAGYIRELQNQFASSVEDYFMIKAQGFRTRIFIADKKKK